MFHILPRICEGIILPSEIRFFERPFWVCQNFFVTKRHFYHKRYFKFFILKLLLFQGRIYVTDNHSKIPIPNPQKNK